MKTVAMCLTSLCLCLVLAACNNDSRNSSVRAHEGLALQIAADIGPLQTWCAQCHAPPSPRLHKRDEWSAVVRRMAHHRLDARMPTMSDEEHKKVVAWLQQYAQL